MSCSNYNPRFKGGTAFFLIDEICKNYSAILFDLDGTLLDSLCIWKDAGKLYLKSLGKKSARNLGKIMFNMSLKEGAEYLKEKYSLDETTTEIINGINNTVFDFYKNHVMLKKGALLFLRAINERGIKCAITTESDLCVVTAALTRLKINIGDDALIKKIFCCPDYNTSKKEPVIFEIASRFLCSPINKTLVFEDTLVAARSAQKAGFDVASFYDKENKNEWKSICALSRYSIKKWK